MPTVVADAAMIDKLAGLTEPADIVSPDGRKLGRFTPEPFCPWDPTLTPEEADRIANEPGGCTLAEIWKRLGVK
jgi:hypothetical protein